MGKKRKKSISWLLGEFYVSNRWKCLELGLISAINWRENNRKSFINIIFSNFIGHRPFVAGCLNRTEKFTRKKFSCGMWIVNESQWNSNRDRPLRVETVRYWCLQRRRKYSYRQRFLFLESWMTSLQRPLSRKDAKKWQMYERTNKVVM